MCVNGFCLSISFKFMLFSLFICVFISQSSKFASFLQKNKKSLLSKIMFKQLVYLLFLFFNFSNFSVL